MKKFLLIATAGFIACCLIFVSCSKDDGGGGGGGGSVCDTINITVSATSTNSVPCSTPAANGTVTVSASGSSGFTYSIDGGAFSSNNVFTSVTEGAHTVTAKDQNGCTKSATVTVNRAASGPQFAAMRNLVTTRCSGGGCHMNGSSAGNYNFDNDCSIVSAWAIIQSECITLSTMPKAPQAPLSTAEKAVITTWINGGHLYSN